MLFNRTLLAALASHNWLKGDYGTQTCTVCSLQIPTDDLGVSYTLRSIPNCPGARLDSDAE